MRYEDKKLRLMGMIATMEGHNVYTPFKLVEELLESAFKNENDTSRTTSKRWINRFTFAVLFNTEFVLTLIEKYSVNANQITLFGDCDKKEKLANGWGCNYRDVNEPGTMTMTEEKSKFDYVVGNPPYQDTRSHGKKITGNGPLWVQFTLKSIELLKENGRLAFVIPDSVLAPTFDLMGEKTSIFNDIFKNKNLVYVNTKIKEHFPDVGINPIAFILENNNKYKHSIINNKKINISTMNFIPKDDSDVSLSIHKKILKSQQNENKFKMRWSSDVRILEKAKFKKTKKAIYPILDAHSYKELRWSEHQDPNQFDKKLLVTYIGKYQCVPDNGKYGAKPQVSIRFITDNESLKCAHSFYDSKLIHWVMNSNKWTQYLLSQILNYIPTPDLNRVWNDNEIFKLFKLTKREIQYIKDSTSEE